MTLCWKDSWHFGKHMLLVPSKNAFAHGFHRSSGLMCRLNVKRPLNSTMKSIRSMQESQSLYTTAWKTIGPGLLIAVMFVIAASGSMMREQTMVADLVSLNTHGGSADHRRLCDWISDANGPVSHSVVLKLPLAQLRDTDGQLTPRGESFFLLLARRMKSLSLSVMLTTDSMTDVEFVSSIAARMLHELSLKSTQVRVGVADVPTTADGLNAQLTVTITRYETSDGDRK